jgi:hypothetical protein
MLVFFFVLELRLLLLLHEAFLGAGVVCDLAIEAAPPAMGGGGATKKYGEVREESAKDFSPAALFGGVGGRPVDGRTYCEVGRLVFSRGLRNMSHHGKFLVAGNGLETRFRRIAGAAKHIASQCRAIT